MANNDELQRVDASVAELQRWWRDAVGGRSSAIVRAEAAEAALAQCRHDLDTMANRVEQADAALAAMQTPCVWTPYHGSYQSVCTKTYWDETFPFCPNCGHQVQVAE